MKTNEELITRAKELSKQTVAYSRQVTEAEDFDARFQLRRKAMESSKRCQAVIGELIRRQATQ